MKKFLWLLVFIGFSISLHAQTTNCSGMITPAGVCVPTSTVANRPTAVTGELIYITDGNSATDCTTGGGSNKVLCLYNGSSWASTASGAGGITGALNSGKVPVASGAQTLADSVINASASQVKITLPDSATNFLLSNTTTGVRMGAVNTSASVEGVDTTGVGSYQPLLINGSVLNLGVGGTTVATVSGAGIIAAGATNTALTVQGGQDATTTGASGTILVKGEDVTGGSTASLSGGAITVRGGSNASTGNSSAGGAFTVNGGDATGGTGTTDSGGNGTIRGGNCTSTTGSCTPGTLALQGGGFTAAFTNGAGQDVTIASGAGTSQGAPSHVKTQHPVLGLASGTTAQPIVTDRVVHQKALSTTSAQATSMFNIASATNTAWGVEILVHVDLISSTPNVCGTTERFSLTGTNNNGAFGTVNIVAGTISTLCSTGTLTLAVSATAANPSVVSITPTWGTITSITSSTLTVEIENVSRQEISLL